MVVLGVLAVRLDGRVACVISVFDTRAVGMDTVQRPSTVPASKAGEASSVIKVR